jgi:Gelsolin repeat
VYLLDTGKLIYQWNGSMSTLQNKSKARIVASRINKHERNSKCEYIEIGNL